MSQVETKTKKEQKKETKAKVKTKIKVLISHHKPSVVLENDVLTPIHVGRAIVEDKQKEGIIDDNKNTAAEDYQWMIDNMIGDDTGDNISELNRRFCETTAIYWAWKNQDKLDNPDYIGFMHYRRHLSFNLNRNFDFSPSGWIQHKELNSKYKLIHRLNEEKINEIVSANDITIGKHSVCNPYEHYQADRYEHLHIKDYDLAIEILKDKYPELAAYADKYNSGKKAYFCNMFIMKKEIFNDYCKVLFDVLFELDKKINYENYGTQEKRAVGYISEWITGIYILSLVKTKKIKELPITYIEDTTIVKKDLLPAFSENNIPIVFSSDNNYSPYLGVAIYSLLKNISRDKNYDIIILDSAIKEINKSRINSLIKEFDNVSIRYFNIVSFYKKYDQDIFFTDRYYTKANYNRLFIPEILHNYDKVIYLDSDILIFEDVSNLYNIDLEDNLIAAVSDIEVIRNRKLLSDYCTEELEIESIFKYFNSGVLLIDIQQCLKNDFLDNCIKELKRVKQPKCVDQCILNIVCEDKIKYLDFTWNVQYHVPYVDKYYDEKLPQRHLKEYNKCLANPKILHFTSANKPWNNLEMELEKDFSAIFWEYARMTPFYERIIYGNAAKPAINWLHHVDGHLRGLEWRLSGKFKFRFFKRIKDNIVEKFIKISNSLSKIINKFRRRF